MKWLFHKKFNVNEDRFKTDVPQLNCKEKCKKWDTKIASGFGLFAFLALVGFVIFTSSPRPGCGSCHRNTKLNSNKVEKKCALESGCKFKCSSINEEEKSVADYLKEELENGNCKSEIVLKITNTEFNKSKLTKGWLEGVNPQVTDLAIEQCITLNGIGDSAFAGPPFENLRSLKIVNANIKVLQKLSFLGLNSLTNFIVRNDNSARNLRIEEGVLEGMGGTLTILELNQYIFTADDIINLIGERAPVLPALVNVALGHNSILELKGYSFSQATKLQQLSLDASGIEKIHQKAFWNQRSLKRLNLSQNLLETLANDTFNSLTTSPGGIQIWDNRWQCDCSLAWLKEYYINTNYINKAKPPLCYKENKEFDQVEFICPNSSSSVLSTDATPSSDLTTTTQMPTIGNGTFPTTGTIRLPPTEPGTSTYEKVKCQERKLSNSVANVDVTHTIEVVIHDRSLKLQFHELEGEPLLVQVTTTEKFPDYHLLWFNADSKSETGCRSPVETYMVLENLNRDTTYSFSLLYKTEPQVSPKCTFCIKTEPEWKYRPWIRNKYQTPVIVLSVGIGILLIFLTGFLTFICIRHHPKIISGNKNVIIVKTKKNSVEDAPPRDYERPAYWEPYLAQSSHGYLTPKYERYAKVKYRPPLRRSVSEWSFASTSNLNSYDDPNQLQAFKILRPIRRNPREIMEADVYDYRPPLPPPNPAPKRPSVLPEEELYSSL